MHRLAGNDAGGFHFHAAADHVGQRAFAVDRVAQTIDHAAEQAVADRDVHDGAGAGDGVALADLAVIAEDHDTDVVGFQVQRHAANARAGEFDHFAGHHVLQAEHAGDAVADGQDLTGLRHVGLGIERGDLLLQNLGNFRRADFDSHIKRLPSWRTASVAAGISNWCRTGGHRSGRPGRREGRFRPAPRYLRCRSRLR